MYGVQYRKEKRGGREIKMPESFSTSPKTRWNPTSPLRQHTPSGRHCGSRGQADDHASRSPTWGWAICLSLDLRERCSSTQRQRPKIQRAHNDVVDRVRNMMPWRTRVLGTYFFILLQGGVDGSSDLRSVYMCASILSSSCCIIWNFVDSSATDVWWQNEI